MTRNYGSCFMCLKLQGVTVQNRGFLVLSNSQYHIISQEQQWKYTSGQTP